VRPLRRRVAGGVAQLVRAPACHAGGRGFKSRLSRHSRWQRAVRGLSSVRWIYPHLRTERRFNPGSHVAAVWPRRMGTQESERPIRVLPACGVAFSGRASHPYVVRRLILRDRATPRGDRQTVRFAPSTRSEARMRIPANKVGGIDAGDREMMVEYH
jgi:hypothetical protein